jgi:hypothetical protein
MEKGYVDFARLHKIRQKEAFFVTSAKNNMRFKRMYSKSVDKTMRVPSDQIGKLEISYSKKDYPGKLNRIKYYDKEHKKTLVFLTNSTDLQ